MALFQNFLKPMNYEDPLARFSMENYLSIRMEIVVVKVSQGKFDLGLKGTFSEI